MEEDAYCCCKRTLLVSLSSNESNFEHVRSDQLNESTFNINNSRGEKKIITVVSVIVYIGM